MPTVDAFEGLLEQAKPIRSAQPSMNYKKPLIQPEQIEQAILLIRGQRVTRTTSLTQFLARPPATYTAGLFRIIDANGSIQ